MDGGEQLTAGRAAAPVGAPGARPTPLRTLRQVSRRRLLGIGAAAGLATACDLPFPGWSTGARVDPLYATRERIDGGPQLVAPPPITGDPGADARIVGLATARGYRLRPVHSGPRVVVADVPVDPALERPLEALLAAADGAGLDLRVKFGYRSVEEQRAMFLEKIDRLRVDAIASGRADRRIDDALRWVAPPGFSKHHSGLTVDFREALGAAAGFETSAAGRWLSADDSAVARHFGFLPSYPPHSGPQGPDPEPWEYNYVGIAALRCAANLPGHADVSRCLTGGLPLGRANR